VFDFGDCRPAQPSKSHGGRSGLHSGVTCLLEPVCSSDRGRIRLMPSLRGPPSRDAALGRRLFMLSRSAAPSRRRRAPTPRAHRAVAPPHARAPPAPADRPGARQDRGAPGEPYYFSTKVVVERPPRAAQADTWRGIALCGAPARGGRGRAVRGAYHPSSASQRRCSK